MRLRARRLAPVAVLLCAALAPPAVAGDDVALEELQKKVASLEGENASLKLKIWWLQRLRGHEPRASSSGTAVHRFAVGADGSIEPATEQDEELRRLRLPDDPSVDDARDYVSRIIIAVQGRGVFGDQDPEVDMLERIGPRHAAVLIEPLVYLEHFNGSNYVVEALQRIVQEGHKTLILQFLPLSQDLVDVLVAKGWTRDAAPTLLKVLAERSPWLDIDWTEAAATVARPDHYADLKFQLAHGNNPWHVWKAIRDLPGMDLDSFVEGEWRVRPRDMKSWEGRSFAVVAAHYGHRDALAVLARVARESRDWKEAFEALTGFQGEGEAAAAWFDRNKDDLVFDRTKRVYVRSAGDRK
jgi:hypothetical protein